MADFIEANHQICPELSCEPSHGHTLVPRATKSAGAATATNPAPSTSRVRERETSIRQAYVLFLDENRKHMVFEAASARMTVVGKSRCTRAAEDMARE
jgi:hypothetical protein